MGREDERLRAGRVGGLLARGLPAALSLRSLQPRGASRLQARTDAPTREALVVTHEERITVALLVFDSWVFGNGPSGYRAKHELLPRLGREATVFAGELLLSLNVRGKVRWL